MINGLDRMANEVDAHGAESLSDRYIPASSIHEHLK